MSDALNFRIAVDDQELKNLNTKINSLRQNFLGLEKDASRSTNSLNKSFTNVRSGATQASKGIKTLSQALRMEVKSVQQAIDKNKALETAKKRLTVTSKYYKQDLALINREIAKNNEFLKTYTATTEKAGKASLKLSTDVASLSKALRMEANSIEQVRAKSQALQAAKANLDKSERNYQKKLDITNRAINKNNAALKRYAQAQFTVSRATTKTTRVMARQAEMFNRNTSLADQFRNQIVGFTSIYAMERLLSTLVKIRGEFEIQNVALTAMLQNKALADRMFLQVQEIALKSPFKILELNKSLKQLKAYRIENTELIRTLSTLGDISAGLGVDMDRLILAFGQIRATSWLRGTELRQLTEAGINILEPLVDKFAELGETGLTTADIMKKIENRMVSFEMVKDIFEDMTEEGGLFYQQQIKQAETLKGKVSILTDAFHKMLNEVGTSNEGALKGAVSIMTELISNVELLADTIKIAIAAFGAYRTAMMFANGATFTMIKSLKDMVVVARNPIASLKRMRNVNMGLVRANKLLVTSTNGVVLSQQYANLWNAKAAVSARTLSVANTQVASSNTAVAVTGKAATASTVAMKAAMGAISAVVAIAVTALATYLHKRKEINEEANKFAEQSLKEALNLTKLKQTLDDQTLTISKRNDELRKARELHTGIVGDLDEQGKATDLLTDSINRQIEALKARSVVERQYGADLQEADEKVDEATKKAEKRAAQLETNLKDIAGSLIFDERVDEDRRARVAGIVNDNDLSLAEKYRKIATDVNMILSDSSLRSEELLKYLERIGGVSVTREGSFFWSPEEGGELRRFERAQRKLDRRLQGQQTEVEKIFRYFDQEAKLEAIKIQRGETPEDITKNLAEDFANFFGDAVEGTRYQQAIEDYIIAQIFPSDWEQNQQKYVKNYFERLGQNVEEGSQEWQEQLKTGSQTFRFARKSLLANVYGLGSIEDIRLETRTWVKTVNQMINEELPNIKEFREIGKGETRIPLVSGTQNIESYRAGIKKIYDEVAADFKGLTKAAENDKTVNQDVVKLYEERLDLLKRIKNYLNIFDDDKGDKKAVSEYFSGFSELLGVLGKIKAETERLKGELDFSLTFGLEVDKQEAEKKIKDSLDEIFTGEGIYNQYEKVYTDFAKKYDFGEAINELFLDEDVTDLDEALRVMLDKVLSQISKELGITGKELENLKDKYGVDINQLLLKEPSNKEFDELVKFRQEYLARETAFGDNLVFTINQTSLRYSKALTKIRKEYEKLRAEQEKRGADETEIQRGENIRESLRTEQFESNKKAAIANTRDIVDEQLGIYKQFLNNVNDASLRQLKDVQDKLESIKLPTLSELLGRSSVVDPQSGFDIEFDNIFQQLMEAGDFDKTLEYWKETLKEIGLTEEQIQGFELASKTLKEMREEFDKMTLAQKKMVNQEIFERIINKTDEYTTSLDNLGKEIEDANLRGQEMQKTFATIAKSLSTLGGITSDLFENFDTGKFTEAREEGAKFFESMQKGFENLETGDSLDMIASGILDFTSLIISAVNEYNNAIDELRDNQRTFETEMRSAATVQRLQETREKGVFGDSWDAQLRSGVEAAKQAENEIKGVLDNIAEKGEAVVGIGKRWDWDRALQGAGAGATLGAGVGTLIVPGIGTAIGAGVGAVGGLVGGGLLKKPTEEVESLISQYPEVIKLVNGVATINEEVARSLISTGIVKDATADWLEEGIALTQEYEAALEQINDVIEELVGSISDNLRDILVQSFIDGTYAAQDFKSALEDVLESMISASIFNATFGRLFQQFEDQIQGALITEDTSDELALMQNLFQEANELVPTFNALMTNATRMAEGFNFDLFKEGADQMNQLSTGLKSMTEQTADILVGQFNSLRDATWRIYNLLSSQDSVNQTNQAAAESVAQLVVLNSNVQAMMHTTNDIYSLFKQVTTAGSGKAINV